MMFLLYRYRLQKCEFTPLTCSVIFVVQIPAETKSHRGRFTESVLLNVSAILEITDQLLQ